MNGKRQDDTGFENFRESAPFPSNPVERQQQQQTQQSPPEKAEDKPKSE